MTVTRCLLDVNIDICLLNASSRVFRHAYCTGYGWFAGKQVHECKPQVHLTDILLLSSLGSFLTVQALAIKEN